MTIKCEIFLNKEEPYIIGEDDRVVGFVKVECTTGRHTKGIEILFYGRFKSRLWITPKGTTDLFPHTNVEYWELTKQKQRYHEDGGLLSMGEESFYFNFPLSSDMLSSLEGTYGHIRYEIIATISYPDSEKLQVVRPISLLKHYDLNVLPIYRAPQHVELRCNCVLALMRSNIRCKLSTPMRAYAPGQIIRYTLEISDKSSTPIISHCIEFFKKITYTFAQGQRDVYSQTVNLYSEEITNNDENDQIITDNIIVPSTPPTLNEHMIRVQYFLTSKSKVSHKSYKFSLALPIAIATIPVKEEESPDPPLTFKESESVQSPFMDYDIEDDELVVGFKPLYAYYKQ